MNPNHTLHASAAEALVRLLPTALPLTAVVTGAGVPAGAAASAVSATFVGSLSADVSVTLVDTASLAAAGGADSALLSVENVLRPALESATAALGTGVLGACSSGDASALFADAEAVVFELSGAAGVAGWFAIRIRENGVVNNHQALPPSSMADKLGRINNVEMSLTVEIGRTRMSVRDVLHLEPGGVVELDRSAGAPADVLLNGRIIAHGEVVVVDQDYAVRITKILDITDGIS
jgi:flagellar motor switch protein FliN/FliY